jgi:5-methylcytosine-specific restriction endonuclease McrA
MGKKRKWISQKRRIWAINRLISQYGSQCYLCKEPFERKEDITLDHWIPKVEGGTDDITNLRLAHDRCNGEKGRLLPEQWEELQSGENL